MLSFPRLGDYGYLGNAMFQYSALLGIADKHGYNPVYDYDKTGTMVTLHEHFKISKAENMEHWKQVHGIKRVWKEPHFHFSESAFQEKPSISSERKNKLGIVNQETPIIKDDTGLNGYFQSEKYFKHIEDTIRSEFKFNEEVRKDCEEKMNSVRDSEDTVVVSIHVRLGDYKVLEHVYVPLVKTPYYQQAIGYMNNEFGENIKFIIFSDEPEICKQMFQGENLIFAEGGSQLQDMCLMSLCDHNIIANSSFSWWGAWLNENENKKVIAPQEWFQPTEKDPKSSKDLYCENWIVL